MAFTDRPRIRLVKHWTKTLRDPQFWFIFGHLVQFVHECQTEFDQASKNFAAIQSWLEHLQAGLSTHATYFEQAGGRLTVLETVLAEHMGMSVSELYSFTACSQCGQVTPLGHPHMCPAKLRPSGG